MKTTVRGGKREAVIDRVLGYTGLFVIGVMAWTCDRLGVKAQAPAVRPAMRSLARGART